MRNDVFADDLVTGSGWRPARLRSYELRRGSLRHDPACPAEAATAAKAGGAYRDRTDDLKLAKLALSQLS